MNESKKREGCVTVANEESGREEESVQKVRGNKERGRIEKSKDVLVAALSLTAGGAQEERDRRLGV